MGCQGKKYQILRYGDSHHTKYWGLRVEDTEGSSFRVDLSRSEKVRKDEIGAGRIDRARGRERPLRISVSAQILKCFLNCGLPASPGAACSFCEENKRNSSNVTRMSPENLLEHVAQGIFRVFSKCAHVFLRVLVTGVDADGDTELVLRARVHSERLVVQAE